MSKKVLYAFVHIEKTGGTSLNHILRDIFFLKFANVRPLFRESESNFTASDLDVYRKYLPLLSCISGHAINPVINLCNDYEVRYLTLLRDPVKRYVSQYIHWVEKKGLRISFEDYLKIEAFQNYQTKKISGGINDLEKAIYNLDNLFFNYGYIEEVTSFIVNLCEKGNINMNKIHSFNVNKSLSLLSRDKIVEEYRSSIEYNNKMDIELYNYVVNNSVVRDVEVDIRNSHSVTHYIDYLMRKMYINPLTNNIRKKNGIRMDGSY